MSLLRLGGGGGNPDDDEDGAGDALLAVAELLLEVAFVCVELFFLGEVGMAAAIVSPCLLAVWVEKGNGLSFGSISEAMKLENYCWGDFTALILYWGIGLPPVRLT